MDFRFQIIAFPLLSALAGIGVYPLDAWARLGTGDIGGGTAIVCENRAGQVTSVEMLDLAEGARKSRYTYPERSENSIRQAAILLGRLWFGYGTRDWLKETPAAALRNVSDPRRIEVIPEGSSLDLPLDTGRTEPIVVPKGCRRAIVGARQKNKYGHRSLQIDDALLSAMSPTHQAAFWVHEALYSYYLGYLDQPLNEGVGTRDIRELTAALFANETKLEDLVEASRFLFLPENGRVLIAEKGIDSVVELVGKVDAFDSGFDTIQNDHGRRFFCLSSETGGKLESQFLPSKPGVPAKLRLRATPDCLKFLNVDGISARLLVNGREILNAGPVSKLRLDFLYDHANFSEMRGRAQYPKNTDPKKRNAP